MSAEKSPLAFLNWHKMSACSISGMAGVCEVGGFSPRTLCLFSPCKATARTIASRWEPPHLCGGRSASALRKKLAFNQCALAPGSRSPGAKAHLRIDGLSRWTKVQLPPAKAGGSHQRSSTAFFAACVGATARTIDVRAAPGTGLMVYHGVSQ